MKRWDIIRTVEKPFEKGEPFRIIFAFTPQGIIKFVGGNAARKEADKLPTCHAFKIQYEQMTRRISFSQTKTEKRKVGSWMVVGKDSSIYTMARWGSLKNKGFALLRRSINPITPRIFNWNWFVLGSWRRLPTTYLKEFQNEAHKLYSWKKVYLCGHCHTIVHPDALKNDDFKCRSCHRSVYEFEEGVLGGTQVSSPIMRATLDQYCDYASDDVEDRINRKGF